MLGRNEPLDSLGDLQGPERLTVGVEPELRLVEIPMNLPDLIAKVVILSPQILQDGNHFSHCCHNGIHFHLRLARTGLRITEWGPRRYKHRPTAHGPLDRKRHPLRIGTSARHPLDLPPVHPGTSGHEGQRNTTCNNLDRCSLHIYITPAWLSLNPLASARQPGSFPPRKETPQARRHA